MNDDGNSYDELLQVGARRLKGHQRRLFQAETCLTLCGGSPRLAERRFGWGRHTVALGIHELQSGIRCLENFGTRGHRRAEDRNPQLARDNVRVSATEMWGWNARLERCATLPAYDITITPKRPRGR